MILNPSDLLKFYIKFVMMLQAVNVTVSLMKRKDAIVSRRQIYVFWEWFIWGNRFLRVSLTKASWA